jgi:hypothetical protein
VSDDQNEVAGTLFSPQRSKAANLNLALAQQLRPTTYNQLGTWQKKPLNNQTNE